jgi:DNA-binding transcriptional regulator YiaG
MIREIDAMTPNQIQALRHALEENTATFGERFLVSGRTVEGWEQGREPHRLVARMLETLAVEVKHAKRRTA